MGGLNGGVVLPPGSGGSSDTLWTVEAIDISGLTNVEAAYHFEGDVNDYSGNELHLNQGVSDVTYLWAYGREWAWGENTRSWGRATHDANLAITGALTIHLLVVPASIHVAWGNDNFYMFAASGETEADNYLYDLELSTNDKFVYFCESGAGANITHQFDVGFPGQVPQLVTLTRDAAQGDVTLYINGKEAGTASTLLGSPSGGSAAKLALYDIASSQGAQCLYGGLVIQSEEMSAADILTIAQQVGVAPS